MKIISLFAISWIGFCGIASVALAEDAHTMVVPNDIKWGPAPNVLPAGAQAAVLFGDPTKEGLFALRLKFPAGYSIPPHTHPVDEVVTVISGTGNLGMGRESRQERNDGAARRQFLRATARHGAFRLRR